MKKMKFSLRKMIQAFMALSMILLGLFVFAFFRVLVQNEKKLEREQALYFANSIAEGQLPYFTSELNEKNYNALLIRADIIEASYRDYDLKLMVLDNQEKEMSFGGRDRINEKKENSSWADEELVVLKRKIQVGNDNLGYLMVKVAPKSQLSQLLKKTFMWAFYGMLILMVIVFFSFRYILSNFLLRPVSALLAKVSEIDDFVSEKTKDSPFVNTNSQIEEFAALDAALLTHSKRLRDSFREKVALENEATRNRTLAEISRQVSHDIRSPLSALSMVVSTLGEIPEENRILIRNSVERINDIANTLLARSKQTTNALEVNESGFYRREVVLLAPLVDALISEKRIQFRQRLGLSIECDLHKSYGVFIEVDPIELRRVLSNIINNSVEAFVNGDGRIEIQIDSSDSKYAVVTVIDNGHGMSSDTLKSIGTQGFSFGKQGSASGSGLGIYHAMKTLSYFGAKLSIESELGKGTKVKMQFPKQATPKWFVPQLDLIPNQMVVALDDDKSILEVWKQRFSDSPLDGIQLITLSCDSELSKWIVNNPTTKSDVLFLIDYELLGQQYSGLDLIENYKINDKAILVTSRYDEVEIKTRCQELGVRQIPKAMAPFIPIQLKSFLSEAVKIDGILIDDDRLIRIAWQMVAKSKGLNFIFCESMEEFEPLWSNSLRDIPIYIDVDLGSGVSGLDVARTVHEKGFTQIYLATGHNLAEFKIPSYVLGVLGKDFPI